VLLSLLSDLERAVGDGDSEQARPLLERLRDMLDDHASREERGVLTELRRAEVDDGYVALFERDHTRLHELFEALEGPDWQTAGRPAMRTIRSARTSRRWTAARSETSELARGLELWEETVDELFDGEVTSSPSTERASRPGPSPRGRLATPRRSAGSQLAGRGDHTG